MTISKEAAQDIAAAGIVVGVRVDRVVVLPGGEPVRLAILDAGGKQEGCTETYAGLDSDGVEWRIAVSSREGGAAVVFPLTPGCAPAEHARFARMADAEDYARHIRARRPDLRNCGDIRIDVGDRLLLA